MKYLLALLSFFISIGAQAELPKKGSNFSIFMSGLQNADVDFVQTKTIPNIKRVFKSVGKIKFVRDKGFIWHQTEPSDFKFISTKKCYRTGNAKNSLSNLPHYSEFSELVDGVLNNNYSMLSSVFSVGYGENLKNWQLVLVPKIDEIKQIFKRITVKGDNSQMSEIKFEYKNNSVVTINFSPSKEALTDEIKC